MNINEYHSVKHWKQFSHVYFAVVPLKEPSSSSVKPLHGDIGGCWVGRGGGGGGGGGGGDFKYTF